jgi:protein-tyrosine phosphatase
MVMSPSPTPTPQGRIDVHSHLLPSIDDGCKSVKESVDCATRMVQAGYTHSFCTPHIWPSLPDNNIASIREHVNRLQAALDRAGVPLKLYPGGEINLRPDTPELCAEELVSFAMAGKFVLVDLWADRLPDFFEPVVRWLSGQGAQVILAHPERMKAVQDDPDLADRFLEMGLKLQGNLQCLGDPPGMATRVVGERFLTEGKYFLLGSDLHNLHSLPVRLEGLRRAIQLVGEQAVKELTVTNPRMLLP